MTAAFRPSIRRRLVLQLLAVAAVLSVLLYFMVRTVARDAVQSSQDSILGAATLEIADRLRATDRGVEVDIPYSAFSMLGSLGQDRVFYRIVTDGKTITGYPDLPDAPQGTNLLNPAYYSSPFRDTRVRVAAVERSILVGRSPVRVVVTVAQTRQGQAAIVASMANRAAALGLGFFVVATLLSLLTASTVLRPLRRLARAVGRRGPGDLRPLTDPAPSELAPFVASLNDFISRFRAALSRTETFIAEAAHHIRTPLATVRAQAEIALRQTGDADSRETLHRMIRAVENSARTASQLLDHAAVIYRTDRRDETPLDLGALAREVIHALGPAAEIKDIDLGLTLPERRICLRGDRLLVESALRNLVDNAIKYSPAEGHIGVELVEDGGVATLTVTDSGRGLRGASTAELGKRFARGSNVDDIVGSGLGLTIVREVATAHGGVFDISDREGGGACARLSLPLR